MSFGLVRLIYNLLFPVVFVAILPAYLVKMWRRGNFREGFGQRFAVYGLEVRERIGGGRRSWLHAVSVGEVLIGLKLAGRLKELEPAFRAVLSTTTTTGYALAKKEAPEWIEVIYHPVDFPSVVRRAVAAIRPERLILIEAEAWPNLVAEVRRIGAPVIMANARLSPRSERRFRAFRGFVAPWFGTIDWVCVQDPIDRGRFEALGVARDRIKLTGSIKFDQAVKGSSEARIDAFRGVMDGIGVPAAAPILLGGSTFPGEEAVLARATTDLATEFPDLFLIVAPRHVERADQAVVDVEGAGLRTVRRTSPAGTGKCRAMVIDTTGELRDWYALATVVFIGKSLLAEGGQNPVEPVVVGKPVIFGPHMENFRLLAAQLAEKGGAVQIADEKALVEQVRRLLRSAGDRERMAAVGEAVIEAHRGATDRTAQLILAARQST
jgi:3-deoxy-D-manno-octulosonic-acid transferase